MGRLNIKRASLVMALMLVGSVFCGCSSTDSSTTDETKSVAPELVKTDGESVSGTIGEQIVNEDIGITLKNVYKIDIDDDENTYVALYVEIVNQSSEERTFSDLTHFGIRLDGSSEDTLDALSPANTTLYIQNNTDFNMLNGTVAANTMLDGVVTAVIPKDFQDCTLVFYPNAATSTGEITFKFTADDFEDLPTK
jgi:outer membrane protein assembly factor BamB